VRIAPAAELARYDVVTFNKVLSASDHVARCRAAFVHDHGFVYVELPDGGRRAGSGIGRQSPSSTSTCSASRRSRVSPSARGSRCAASSACASRAASSRCEHFWFHDQLREWTGRSMLTLEAIFAQPDNAAVLRYLGLRPADVRHFAAADGSPFDEAVRFFHRHGR
jgi:hypothetical protein